MPYCPNCSAQLEVTGESSCWNCRADFSRDSAWKPTAKPLGTFRKFPEPLPPKPAEPIEADGYEMHPLLNVAIRILGGGVVWLISFGLLLDQAHPSGVSAFFALFLLVAIIAVPIWAFAPLLTFLKTDAATEHPIEEAREKDAAKGE